MKELSIQEKATRYDEAIERAESIYNETAIPSATTKGICTYIFPELKESEDERISGNIIATIHLYYGEPLEYEAKEMIAWLEKQCEQKIKTPDESLGIDSDTYNKIADECIYGEQKPDWSEEIEAAISLLKHIAEEQEKDYCPHNANALRKAAQYLESIRPQNTWKPSDEHMNTLEYYMHTLVCNEHKEVLFGLYADLKKLREE